MITASTDFSETDAGLVAKRLVDEGRLTKEELEIADIKALNRFLESPLCKKLQSADEIYKELPFNIHIDAKHLSESAEGETVQLQGTIDCLAIWGDTILIVDFKTDKITNSNLNERIELYRTQLEYYKLGVQKLFPGKNISASIYFLSIDHEERLF